MPREKQKRKVGNKNTKNKKGKREKINTLLPEQVKFNPISADTDIHLFHRVCERGRSNPERVRSDNWKIYRVWECTK